MTYYRVRPVFDNHNVDANHFLVANELYTPAEIRKLEQRYNRYYTTPLNFSRMFDVVEVSKRDTYCFFGARFSSETGCPDFSDGVPFFSR